MSSSTASMASSRRSVGSTSSRSLRTRVSTRSGNNDSWKRNIHFKTAAADKNGMRKAFFKAILNGDSIRGQSIPKSWYTSVWDTQDNKLVAFVTKVALHAHMRDDEDTHYVKNLRYVIDKAPSAGHAIACTKDKSHYCITHIAARYAHNTDHIEKVKEIFTKKFSAKNWTDRAGRSNHRGKIATNYLHPRTENNHRGHDFYKGIKLSKAAIEKRLEAKKEQDNAELEKARKKIDQLESQLMRSRNTRRLVAESRGSRSGPSMSAGMRRRSNMIGRL